MTAAPFPDAFASASGAQSMRDVLSRRCAEQAVEIAALRKECERLRRRVGLVLAAYRETDLEGRFAIPARLGEAIKDAAA